MQHCRTWVDQYAGGKISYPKAVAYITGILGASMEGGVKAAEFDASFERYQQMLSEATAARSRREEGPGGGGAAKDKDKEVEVGGSGAREVGRREREEEEEGRGVGGSAGDGKGASREEETRRSDPDESAVGPHLLQLATERGVKHGRGDSASDNDDDGPERKKSVRFPWEDREPIHPLTGKPIHPHIVRTLELQREWSTDIKRARSSLRFAAAKPGFPASQYRNMLEGLPVDLNQVNASINTYKLEENRKATIGSNLEIDFGVAAPVKSIENASQWFDAWEAYTEAVELLFPFRKAEFVAYGKQIRAIFRTTPVERFSWVIALDSSIRQRVADTNCHLLNDFGAFADLQLLYLTYGPPGKGSTVASTSSAASTSGKRTGKKGICINWNRDGCTYDKCNRLHQCFLCKSPDHKVGDPRCKTKRS
jgi:hypothetical protein